MISKSELFRQRHFLEMIKSFDLTRGPLDVFINLYFRSHPQLGSKDRLFIVERIYTYFRWKLLIEALVQEGNELIDLVGKNFPIVPKNRVPEYVMVSFPENLFRALEHSFGDQTASICLACNEKAPITIRVNSLKTTREKVALKLREHGIDVEEIKEVPYALMLSRRVNLTQLPEYKDGLFEIQDAGSQKVAELLSASPGDLVLDYCAGACGKTLAFAHRLCGQGQIFVHDIRKDSLLKGRERLRRAGVQNVQFVNPEEGGKLDSLKGKMDWVFLDVPCSGTGTLRRNPDLKWKFSEDTVASLIQEQRDIFKKGISFVKKGGHVVYATCSLLREENEEQVAWFLNQFPVEVEGDPFSSRPSRVMDGFFAVKLRLK